MGLLSQLDALEEESFQENLIRLGITGWICMETSAVFGLNCIQCNLCIVSMVLHRLVGMWAKPTFRADAAMHESM